MMRQPGTRNLVLFFTFLAGAVYAELPSLEEVPKDAPKEGTLKISESQEMPSETWEIGSTLRTTALYPSNWGTVGLFHLRSAESLPQGALAFGIGGEFYSVTSAPDFGNGPTKANTIAESLFVGYSPLRELTLAVMRRNSSTTFETATTGSQLISSLGDFNFSATYTFRLTPSLALAPILDLVVASNFNSLTPAGSTLSAGVGAALTYSLYPTLAVPMFIHFNALYHAPQIRSSKQTLVVEPETFFRFSRFHTMTWGLGLEYQVGDFVPFAEFLLTQTLRTGTIASQTPSHLSVGTRITPLENKSLAILLGADIGISRDVAAGIPYTAPLQILGQLSYTLGLTSTERKHYVTTSDVNVVDRRFVIRKNINFKTASAELEPSSVELIDQVAQVIKENNVRKLLILGHTDSSHTDRYNLKLSLDRALTVKRGLVSRGVGEDVLIAQGYGKTRPKASNSTEEGRATNRRVEFFILDQ